METGKINIQLEKKDYKNFVMQYHKERFVFMGIFVVFYGAILFWLQYPYFFMGDMFTYWPILFIIGIFSLSYFSLRYQAGKMFDSDVAINRPYEVQMDSEKVSAISVNGETNYSWKDIHGYKISKDYIFIFYTAIKGLIIPIRSFNDPAQAEKVREILLKVDNSKYKSAIRKRNAIRIGIYVILMGFVIYFIASTLYSVPHGH